MSDEPPRFSIGIDEVGPAVGISRTATYEAIRTGELKTFKYGRRRLVLIAELKAFIERIAKKQNR